MRENLWPPNIFGARRFSALECGPGRRVSTHPDTPPRANRERPTVTPPLLHKSPKKLRWETLPLSLGKMRGLVHQNGISRKRLCLKTQGKLRFYASRFKTWPLGGSHDLPSQKRRIGRESRIMPWGLGRLSSPGLPCTFARSAVRSRDMTNMGCRGVGPAVAPCNSSEALYLTAY